MSQYFSNYHSNEWIQERIQEHVNDILLKYPEDRIIGVFYQGSGNYGLDYEGSDVDTKCIILPSVYDLHDMKRESVCHVRSNDEHTDVKDVRLMFELFIKANVNFLEILYTPFYWVNPLYEDLWNEVIEIRDLIISANRANILKSLKGIAGEKYHALEHRYPSRISWIDKFGYDPKQLHHLIRIEEFTRRWLNGVSFKDCLISKQPEALIEMKKGWASLAEARKFADDCMHNIETWYKDEFDKIAPSTTESVTKALCGISTRMLERYLEVIYR